MTVFKAHNRDRVQVFIDGQNVYGSLRAMGKKMNWKALLSALTEDTRLVRANYFTTVREHNATDKFYGMLTFLETTGYTVVEKTIRDTVDANGNVRFRGSVIGEITAGMVSAAYNETDHIYLFSGDSEMCAAVEACKAAGTRVTVVSTEHVISDELRRLADECISIGDFPSDIVDTEFTD